MWQKIRNWRWGDGLIIFVIAFFASVLGATVAVSQWEAYMRDQSIWHFDIAHADEDKHSENLMNAYYAVEMMKFAKNENYDGILEKSCQILLRSVSNISPEIWEEGSRRDLAEKHKREGKDALISLFESRYCTFLSEEEKKSMREL